MKLSALLFLITMPLLVLAGGPKVKSINASTTEMSPGDMVTVTVKLKGNASMVESMEFIVREFAYDVPPFALQSIDDKKNRIWEVKIPVPYESPSGDFNLELKITMEDGSQLEIEGHTGNAYGKAGTLPVTVI